MRIATVLAVALVGTTCLADAEHAQAAIQQYQLNIPRQSLDTALNDLAQQTGLQIGRFSERIDGSAVVGPVEGPQTPAQALKILLRDTGLDYKIVGDTTLAVFNPNDVDSVGKLEGDGRPIGSSQRCSGFSGANVNSATTLNQTDADSAAIGWSGLNWTSDCAAGYSGGNQVLASAEGEQDGSSLRNSGGNSDLNRELKEDSKLEEIVVTAQKREERLQDVPLSISVLDGRKLDSSTFEGVSQALRTVPGVATTAAIQGNSTQITIRGVSAAAPVAAGESTSAYYLDTIPFKLVGWATVPDANVYDLERIEVVRGPQGTLVGSNAMSGVVRVLTHNPDFEEFELKGRGSTSSTKDGGESYRGDLAVNVPIVAGKVAARGVLSYQDLSGWIDKPNGQDANSADIMTARFKLGLQPNERSSVVLAAWISRSDLDAPNSSSETNPVYSVLPLDEPTRTDYDIYSLTADYEFSGFSVTSTSSYIDFINEGFQDRTPLAFLNGGVPFGLVTRTSTESFSQEVYFNSNNDGKWRWILGGSYGDENGIFFQKFGPLTPVAAVDNYGDTESYAVFGELTRVFLDGRLELAGGLRYFYSRSASGERQDFSLNSGGAGDGLETNEGSFEKVTPRLALTWHPNNDLTVYTAYGQGYRGGGSRSQFIRTNFPQLEDLKPDTLDNYEIGAKGGVWDGRLTFDSAIYYLKWKDQQQSLGVPVSGSFISVPVNGTSASGLGVEFAATVRILDGLTLGGNFSWSGLTNDTDVISFTTSAPVGIPVVVYPEGSRNNFSPEYTAGISLDYEFPLGGSGYNGRFSTSANYRSEIYRVRLAGATIVNHPGDEWLFVDARFAVDAPSGRWSTVLFADNINNEQGGFQGFNLDTVLRPRPRTIGLQFEFRY